MAQRPAPSVIPPPVDSPEDLAVDEAPAESAVKLIAVNSATKTVLVGLPGIGPASADAIIAHRPYTSLEEMIEKAALTRLTDADIETIANSVTFD